MYGEDDPETPLTEQLIEHVIDHVTKEGKMPARDGVPITWHREAPHTARQIDTNQHYQADVAV